MEMSLVAAYGDSDSDNNSDGEFSEIINGTTCHKDEPTSEASSCDEDDASQQKLTSSPHVQMNTATMEKLPIPGFLSKANGSQNHLPTTSVFSNPFAEAEQAKKSALEKHVKMVDGVAAVMINGKKVCWNYRKGRCRFGHNCKYAHDSDLQKSDAQLAAENRIQETVLCESDNTPRGELKHINQGTLSISEEEIIGNQNAKRKRPGLTQGLQPGKKVLKQYQKLKNQY